MSPLITAALLTPLLLAAPATLAAQEPTRPQLPLKRERPVVEWQGCPRPDAAPVATAEARTEAERLAAEATESAIIGDNEAALVLLNSAAALDPASDRIAYLRARALDLLGRREDALAEYCRYVGVAPAGAELTEVTDRVAELARMRGFAVAAAAADAHATGLAHFDAGRIQNAEAAFGGAVAAAPAWATAVYNRGVARLALGRTEDAGSDLRRYLELNPGANDFGTVLDLLGELQAGPRTYSPTSALAAGLIVPGLGHFTTGRPARGAVFLGGAAGFVAVGLLVSRTAVDCLSPTVDGRCPPDQVLRQNDTRPLLLPALAGAVVTGIIGAIDAYRGAQAASERLAPARREGVGLPLGTGYLEVGAALSTDPGDLASGAARARITLLQFRF
jgi:tetratricopeptide (TPR) repeat protein